MIRRAALAAGIGLGLLSGAIGLVSEPGLLPMWLTLGGIVGGAVYVVLIGRTEPEPPSHRVVLRKAVAAGVATAGGCLVITGLVSVLGAAAAPVVPILLVAAGVWAWRALPDLSVVTEEREPPATPTPPQPGALPTPGELPTPALCRAWQHSYFALLDTSDGPARDDLTAWRRTLLDELERRDPAGFERWISSGARAGSDPSRDLDLATDH